MKVSSYLFYLLIFSSSVTVAKSEKKSTDANYEIKNIAATESYKKIKVPRSIIEKIDQDYLKNYKRLHPESVERDIDLLLSVERNLFEIEMSFWGEEHSPLNNQKYNINFPAGGGVVDLDKVLQGERGSFELKLKAWKSLDVEADNIKVLFVSQTPVRKVDSFEVGAGCDKLLDITSYYKSTISNSLKINATKGMHLGVIGGIFIFYSVDVNSISIAVVQVKHSGKEYYFCEK